MTIIPRYFHSTKKYRVTPLPAFLSSFLPEECATVTHPQRVHLGQGFAARVLSRLREEGLNRLLTLMALLLLLTLVALLLLL